MEIEVLVNFILVVALGAIIGLQREITHQKEKARDFAGVRSFILIAVLSFIIAHITLNLYNSFLSFITIFVCFMLLMIAAYVIMAIKFGRLGVTTEIAAIITFLLAAIITADLTKDYRLVAIIIGVLVASFLALKEHLHRFAKNIKMFEVYAAIKLALISLIILPLLPNKAYSLLDVPLLKEFLLSMPRIAGLLQEINVFNPFKIWLVVVFISGLSFLGYVAVKTFGVNKGIGLTSFFGGFMSSTAVTVSLSEKSKESKNLKPFIFGILLASSVMFVRVLILVSALNASLLKSLVVPVGGMALAGFLISFIVFKMSEREEKGELKVRSPFALSQAIKFGIFFVFVLFISKILFILIGNSGVYLSSLIAGLADVDAITLSLSSMSSLALNVATVGIVIAICANTLIKVGIAYYNNKKLALPLSLLFLLILALGLILALV